MEPGLFLVDAFANGPLTGNPAAVCLLREHADESWMARFAAEMNQAETAFVVPRPEGAFDLRWFTPTVEVDLCGHATLASAHVLFEHVRDGIGATVGFHTKSGLLTAAQTNGLIRLDFPATPPEPFPAPEGLAEALGADILWSGKSKFDYLLELSSDSAVRKLEPDIAALGRLPARGIMVTAKSDDPAFDFVSRFFAPASGVNEDHATGSAHCCLTPFWAERLRKARMKAFQASFRGGWFEVELDGDRVFLEGKAVTVVVGKLA